MTKWTPIEDLPRDWHALALPELHDLSSVWQKRQEELGDSPSLKEFLTRLKREWAIETGILENLYNLDKGMTETLLELGISDASLRQDASGQPAEKFLPIIQDQEDVIEGLFDFVAGRREITGSYIKQLHQELTRNQHTTVAKDQFGKTMEVTLVRGEWKRHANNPTRPDGVVHEYCPPEQVDSEMDTLITLHHEHENLGVFPEIEAAWLHHRFTQIHPFQDGNGRVARAIASIVFLRKRWFPLVINREDRRVYIDALEKADQGDLIALIEFFGLTQKRSITKALSLSEAVLADERPLDELLRDAKLLLMSRRQQQLEAITEQAISQAKLLEEVSQAYLESVCQKIAFDFGHLSIFSAVNRNEEQKNDWWYYSQIVQIAKEHYHYFADTRTYKGWITLGIREEQLSITKLVLSFHAIGTKFTGVMGVSAFLERRDMEEGDSQIDGPYPMAKDIFQFVYNENRVELQARYRRWLEAVTLEMIHSWRSTL